MKNHKNKNISLNSPKNSEIYDNNDLKDINSVGILTIPRITHYLCGYVSYAAIFSGNYENEIFKHYNYSVFLLIFAILGWSFVGNTVVNEFSRDFYSAMAVIPSVMGGSVIAIQGTRLHFWRKKISKLYKNMMNTWDSELKNGLNEKIVKNARKSIYLSKFYCCLSLMLLLSFVLRPFNAIFIHFVIDNNATFIDTRVLPATYPFEVDSLLKYVICNIYETYSMLFGCVAWTAVDTGFIQTTTFLSLQLQVLEHKFRDIVKEYDNGDEQRLISRLKSIAKEHREALIQCGTVEDLYSPVLLAVMISTSLSIGVCVICFEKELSDGNFQEATIFFIHAVTFLLQTAAYCNAAQNVSDSSENIARAIYECQWMGQSKKFQKSLLMMMARSQQAYEFRTYGLYEVNRIQFTKIVMLAYNLFSALKTLRLRESHLS